MSGGAEFRGRVPDAGLINVRKMNASARIEERPPDRSPNPLGGTGYEHGTGSGGVYGHSSPIGVSAHWPHREKQCGHARK